MKITKVLELMMIERECVRRQGGVECPRNCHPEHGCYGCDLVQDGGELLDAYDEVIKHYQNITNTASSIMDAYENLMDMLKEGE